MVVVRIEHGDGGAVGPGTGRSAPTARRSSETRNGSLASRSSNDNDIHRAGGSERDEQVSSSRSRLWTPMDVDAIGKGKGKGCFVHGRPGHAAKEGKGLSKVKTKNTTDENSHIKFEGECRHCRLPEASGRSEGQESPRR